MAGMVRSIGFIGAGNVANALTRGFLAAKLVDKSNLIASAPTEEDVAAIKKLGIKTTLSNSQVVDESQVVVLAVKPHYVSQILTDVSDSIRDHHTIMSVAAGITIRTIEKHTPQGTRVVRAMPNTPVVVQEGATVCSPGSYANKEDLKMAVDMFSCVGKCYEMDEQYLDIVTALSGCGPAYAYTLIDALADGGVVAGLTKDLALLLTAQTMLGAAKMILETGRHPGQLKDSVCSPAGTSIQGVNIMERAGIRGILMETVDKACQRARELAEITNGNPHKF